MVEIIQRNEFSNINIIDVYDIIDIYRNSFNENDNFIGHDNCYCKQIFNKQSCSELKSKKVDNMKLYLKNHFEKVNEIKHIMSLFHDKYPNINWLIHYPITYKDTCEFKIQTHFDIIGYDENTVMICYIKPQFNLLNYNEVLMHSILDTYFLKMVNKNTTEKFHGKEIITCVFSLELNEPYYIDWKDTEGRDLIDANANMILDAIYNYILETYMLENNRVFYFYKYWREHCPENNRSPSKFIRFLKEQIDNTKTGLLKNIKMPIYIEKFIDEIDTAIDNVTGKEKKESILRDYEKNTVFFNKINNKLEKSIKYYLNIDEDD